MTAPKASDGGVVVAVVDGGSWSSTFGRSMVQLMLRDTCTDVRIVREGCGLIQKRASAAGLPAARGEVMERFMKQSEAEWLFTVDSDMGFHPDIVDNLIDTAISQGSGITGALCFGLRSEGNTTLGAERFEIVPTIYDMVTVGDTGEGGFRSRLDYERGGVLACAATGAAAMLIHRDAIEAIYSKMDFKRSVGAYDMLTIPEIGGNGTPRQFSEDMSFCLRAGFAGCRIVVDTNVKTTHDKGGIFLDEEIYQASRKG